ncbi:cyanate transporter [Paracoccus cavernae]
MSAAPTFAAPTTPAHCTQQSAPRLMPMPSAPVQRDVPRGTAQARRLVLLATIAVIGLNLRPFMTAVGPLSGQIHAATGLDLARMSLLTLVPMLLMGVVAFAGPALQGRFGAKPLVIAALAALLAGSGARLFVESGNQLIATAAVLGLGAAIIQAVFPGMIKGLFPHQTGMVMGLYSGMLMGGGALGAQLAPRIAARSGDWHIGLGWVVVLPVIGLALACAFLPRPARKAQSPRGKAGAGLIRQPRLWLLMGCFGLVNGGYSSVVAWLSPSYQALGWDSAPSGSLLAVLALFQAASALFLPILARRGHDRRPWLALTLAAQFAGFSGLAFWPEAAPLLWAALLGAGLGGCFSMSLIVALEHLPDPAEAGALSAMMQGGGFLLASLPPFLLARLHDWSGGFATGWLLHLAAVLVVAVLVTRLSPASYGPALQSPTRG